MSGTTWGKWFWSDWMADPGVRVSSYAARGLWMDALCLCAENGGYLQVGGKPLTSAGLARATGGSESEVKILLDELETNEVFSRDRRGCIYSRRMLKDEKKARTARANGKKGGEASLAKQKENSPSGGQKPKPQIPDTRIQSPKKEERLEPALALSGGEATRPKRAMRLADDWQPSEVDTAFALKRGIVQERIPFLAEKFRNHWVGKSGKDAVSPNWSARWRTWCINEVEWNGRGAKINGGSNGKPQRRSFREVAAGMLAGNYSGAPAGESSGGFDTARDVTGNGDAQLFPKGGR